MEGPNAAVLKGVTGVGGGTRHEKLVQPAIELPDSPVVPSLGAAMVMSVWIAWAMTCTPTLKVPMVEMDAAVSIAVRTVQSLVTAPDVS